MSNIKCPNNECELRFSEIVIPQRSSSKCYECGKLDNNPDVLASTEPGCYTDKTIRPEQAEEIVNKIISDLSGRSGVGDEWYGIDKDIQEEIKSEWIAIVLSV